MITRSLRTTLAAAVIGVTTIGVVGVVVFVLPEAHRIYNVWRVAALEISADRAWAAHRFPEADRDRFAATRVGPTSSTAWFDLAVGFVSEHNLPAAEQAARQGLARCRRKADLYYVLGTSLELEGHSAQARQYFLMSSRLRSRERGQSPGRPASKTRRRANAANSLRIPPNLNTDSGGK